MICSTCARCQTTVRAISLLIWLFSLKNFTECPKTTLIIILKRTLGAFQSLLREKKEDLTQSYDESPRKIQKATSQHKNATKTSISRRLRTDLGWSVWVTIATQLLWLNRFTESKPFPLTTKPYNQKDTHLKICK